MENIFVKYFSTDAEIANRNFMRLIKNYLNSFTDRNYLLSELSKVLDVRPKSIEHYLTGKIRPAFNKILILKDYLKASNYDITSKEALYIGSLETSLFPFGSNDYNHYRTDNPNDADILKPILDKLEKHLNVSFEYDELDASQNIVKNRFVHYFESKREGPCLDFVLFFYTKHSKQKLLSPDNYYGRRLAMIALSRNVDKSYDVDYRESVDIADFYSQNQLIDYLRTTFYDRKFRIYAEKLFTLMKALVNKEFHYYFKSRSFLFLENTAEGQALINAEIEYEKYLSSWSSQKGFTVMSPIREKYEQYLYRLGYSIENGIATPRFSKTDCSPSAMLDKSNLTNSPIESFTINQDIFVYCDKPEAQEVIRESLRDKTLRLIRSDRAMTNDPRGIPFRVSDAVFNW